jgi:hypothetical protein
MEEIVGAVPTWLTKSASLGLIQGSFALLRFRLRAPAALTPAKRLKFDPDKAHQSQQNFDLIFWGSSLALLFAAVRVRSRHSGHTKGGFSLANIFSYLVDGV